MPNIFKRKHFLISLLFFGIILAGTWIWHARAETKNASLVATPPTPVKIESVSLSSFQSTETFSGFVRGIHQADISAKTSGYIISLLKEPGERVRSGDLLAVLDGHELITSNQSANLILTAALATLDRTEHYTRQQVDAAETSLSKVKDDRERGSATSKDVRVAEDAVRTAKKLRDVENAQATASVAAIQGAEITAKDSLENRFVRAPFSGIISAKHGVIGAFTSPGNTLYSILSPDSLEISISVPLRVATSIQKDTVVSIQPEHSNQQVAGVVFSIAPAGNAATGETIATIRFRDSNDKTTPTILSGEYASVGFPIEPAREALLIPDSAIVRQYDETFVFTVIDSHAHKQPVKIGGRSGDSREIISGLNPNDTIVTEGMHSLREGMPVQTPHHE